MSKELEALSKIKSSHEIILFGFCSNDYEYAEEFDVIEQALKEYDQHKAIEEKTHINFLQLPEILEHIFVYDKLGKVIVLFSPVIQSDKIKARIGNTVLWFEWKDLGVKFFSNKEACEKAAKEYLERVTQFVSLKTFKKILRVMNIKKEIVFYRRNKEGKVEPTEVDEVNWFDKQTLTLVSIYQWDDGEGYGGEERFEYPLSTYGKDWALTREELDK